MKFNALKTPSMVDYFFCRIWDWTLNLILLLLHLIILDKLQNFPKGWKMENVPEA